MSLFPRCVHQTRLPTNCRGTAVRPAAAPEKDQGQPLHAKEAPKVEKKQPPLSAASCVSVLFNAGSLSSTFQPHQATLLHGPTEGLRCSSSSCSCCSSGGRRLRPLGGPTWAGQAAPGGGACPASHGCIRGEGGEQDAGHSLQDAHHLAGVAKLIVVPHVQVAALA